MKLQIIYENVRFIQHFFAKNGKLKGFRKNFDNSKLNDFQLSKLSGCELFIWLFCFSHIQGCISSPVQMHWMLPLIDVFWLPFVFRPSFSFTGLRQRGDFRNLRLRQWLASAFSYSRTASIDCLLFRSRSCWTRFSLSFQLTSLGAAEFCPNDRSRERSDSDWTVSDSQHFIWYE